MNADAHPVGRFPRGTPSRRLFHLAGIALVLNSLNTYLFTLLFTRCSFNQLSPNCHGYGAFDDIVRGLGDLMMINLLLRFMVLVGFALDGLALAYLASLILPKL